LSSTTDLRDPAIAQPKQGLVASILRNARPDSQLATQVAKCSTSTQQPAFEEGASSKNRGGGHPKPGINQSPAHQHHLEDRVIPMVYYILCIGGELLESLV
jgi:hypothetical protein